MSFKRLIYICLVIIFPLLLFLSCSNNKQGQSGDNNNAYLYPEIAAQSEVQDTTSPDVEEDIEEDTYSIYTDPCVECAWYFCGNLDVVWQKQICINNCDDPPTVVHEGECIEYLQCDPTQYLLEKGFK